MKTPVPWFGLPLYTQVLIAVALGTMLGVLFGTGPLIGSLRNEHLGQLGILAVQTAEDACRSVDLLAILDAFVRTHLPLRQGTKLLLICFVNVSVAMAIGLLIMNTWKPGLAWRGVSMSC